MKWPMQAAHAGPRGFAPAIHARSRAAISAIENGDARAEGLLALLFPSTGGLF
jgi:hypothetical protein